MGTPYLQYGVQITPNRTGNMTEAQQEEFYQKAREVGFEKVAVAVRWCEIEPWENAYNLYSVEKIITCAEKYDLDVEILWFGSNVCGSRRNSPSYVLNNSERFPVINSNFDYTNTELLNRESKAIGVMMNFIYDTDTNCRVSMVQIENEPNFKNAQTEQRAAFLNYLDTLGLAVKNSPYKVLTRVNLVINDSYLETENTLPEEILALDGIDMVGPDVYTNSAHYYNQFIERFSGGTMSDNIMHFAEAPGQVDTYLKLVMNALSKHSGYFAYELKSYGNANFDLGIFRKDDDEWTCRDGSQSTAFEWNPDYLIPESVTDDIIKLNAMISAIDEQLILCGDNIATVSKGASTEIAGVTFGFATDTERTQNHIAMVLLCDGYYYLFTPDANATFTLGAGTDTTASVGAFVDGIWKETDSVQISDGTFDVTGGNVYRIAKSHIS